MSKNIFIKREIYINKGTLPNKGVCRGFQGLKGQILKN